MSEDVMKTSNLQRRHGKGVTFAALEFIARPAWIFDLSSQPTLIAFSSDCRCYRHGISLSRSGLCHISLPVDVTYEVYSNVNQIAPSSIINLVYRKSETDLTQPSASWRSNFQILFLMSIGSLIFWTSTVRSGFVHSVAQNTRTPMPSTSLHHTEWTTSELVLSVI